MARAAETSAKGCGYCSAHAAAETLLCFGRNWLSNSRNTMKRVGPIIALLAAILLLGGARAGATQGGMPGGDALWFNPPEQGAPRVTLHVFWSKRCPHCLEALRILEAQEWVREASVFGHKLHLVVDDPERGRLLVREALEAAGGEVESVERIVPSLEDVFIHYIEREEAS